MILIDILDLLKNNKAIPPFIQEKGNFVVDDYAGISLLTAAAIKNSNNKYLLITSNLYKAQKIYTFLEQFIKDEVLFYPCDELIRAEKITSSKELLANRIFALNEMLKNKPRVVVTNLPGLLRYLPDPNYFKSFQFEFKIGDKVSLHNLKKQLVLSGYSLVNKIDQTLQFAVRGDIIDIFSVNNENPIRIELFGDEIESIREFDISTQKSIKICEFACILPANEMLISDEELFSGVEKIRNILSRDKDVLDSNVFYELLKNTDDDISNLLEHNFSVSSYKYYGLMQNKHFSLLDYLKDYTNVFVDLDSIKNSERMLLQEAHEYLYELYEKGINISHLQYYQPLSEIISSKDKIIATNNFVKSDKDIFFNVRNIGLQASKRDDAFNIINMFLNDEYKICISLTNKEQINLVSEFLLAKKIPYEVSPKFILPKKYKILITTCDFVGGFECVEEKFVCLTSNELFNERIKVGKFDTRFKRGAIISSFEDLEPDDYVVHEYQGIGKFVCLENIEVDGEKNDFIKIEYSNGEMLYIPLTQFQLIRKYQGKEGSAPRLSRLHSKDWENTKAKIKEKINELATRLFDLFKTRSLEKGFVFQQDDEFQASFENAFPYELTKDQKRTVEEIKKDMLSDKPMDRLVCGDVGFGKTEVAFRAIFRAISSGKQAAILCPTTLLARQHYERAIERFKGFDVKIAIFSRLIPEKIQNQYIKEIAEGKIHLVIGTHRLLSNEIVFKDLGFLVVDEEQRFGVQQKEKIKELKTNIDVLTLSATPIPRTLQISLLGVRSLSLMNTAPVERMPVQTYVLPYDKNVVKELIERELGREGQVFYLSNNVSSLHTVATKLHLMVPSARIGVAHGKMDHDEIEAVMDDFYSGNIDVLVCTSIIENGIDVPNANMIIVEDSDHYGLSQLYQIKGRVGRSNRLAYAYLMYNPYKILNEKAEQRLKAIQEFTELGSGYKIAQRDLLIRGAGDILGPEQAGFIDSIGLDLYIKLLNEAVNEKMGIKTKEVSPTNLSLKIEGYIPKDYANDADKIELYQEILSATSTISLADIQHKVRDIYGEIPKQMEALFFKRMIDILFDDIGAHDISENQRYMEFYLGDSFINIKGVGNLLFEAVIPYISLVKISFINNQFKITLNKNADYLDNLKGLLLSIREILLHHQSNVVS